MQIKQIIEQASPLAHWTAERYNPSNVFDEQEVWTLVNNNAILGEGGHDNHNFANRSINLRGGYLQVLDATFGESSVAVGNFRIQFSFKLPGRTVDNPISGFKPIIQKWSPEQEYMIGFENGHLVAKVQTASAGLIELDFPYDRVVYNDRWVHVELRVTSTDVHLYVNNIHLQEAYTGGVNTSSNSLFTIGGIGGEQFGEDVLVNDIAFLQDSTNEYYDELSYIMPRSNIEMWLNLAPAYYFPIVDMPDILKAIPNLGYAGGSGYIVYDPAGDLPYKRSQKTTNSQQTVRMPANSWFAIDQPDIDIDQNEGFSLAFTGDYDEPDSTSEASHVFRIADMRNNDADDNGRFLLSYNYNYNSSSSRRYFGYRMHSAAGTVDSEVSNYLTYNESADIHYEYGTRLLSFEAGVFDSMINVQWDNNTSKSFNNMAYTWNKSLPFAVNRFWYNLGSGGSNSSDLAEFAIFNYKVPQHAIWAITTPRFQLIANFMNNKYTDLAWWAYGFADTSYNNIQQINTRTNGPYNATSGHTYATALVDPNFNRQNQWIGASYLATIGSYTGGGTSQDDIDIELTDFTINIFVWNRNTTSRELFIYNTSGLDIEVQMNSRDGAFSYGDIEFSADRMAAGQTISTHSQTFVDDGFHMLTLVRRGFVLEIWVDGELESSIITSSVIDVDDTNTTFRVYGGPLYFNDWSIWMHNAWEPSDIELAYAGFKDVLRGQSTLDGNPLPSTLLMTTSHDGEVVQQYATGADGRFDIRLPKSINNHTMSVLAIAQDDNASNNVVVHGPYNLNTVYSKYANQVFDQSLADMILDMEPYAFYPMDETTGTTIADASGAGRDGTVTGGITLAQNSFSTDTSAILFDGVNGYIDLPDGYDNMSNGFTVEAWVNYNAFNASSRIFEVASGNSGPGAMHLVNNSTTAVPRFVAQNSAGSSAVGDLTSSSNYVAGTWQHIAVRIAPDGTYTIWVNGINTGTDAGALPPSVLRTINYLGRSSYPSDGYYSGYMSHVATYDHALSDEDIEKHARRGFDLPMPTMESAILQDNPDVYFPFDRTDTFVEKVDGDITLTQNGSFHVSKNSLAINRDAVANNWLSGLYRIPPGTERFSVEFSFKTGVTHTDAVIVSEWNQGSDNGLYKFQIDASNRFKLFVVNGSIVIESTTLYNDDEWHHVMGVYDGATLRLYVDGVEEDSVGVSITTLNQYDTAIGNTSDGSVSHHMEATAYVDDVAIYSHELGTVRVAEHYSRFQKKKVYQ